MRKAFLLTCWFLLGLFLIRANANQVMPPKSVLKKLYKKSVASASANYRNIIVPRKVNTNFKLPSREDLLALYSPGILKEHIKLSGKAKLYIVPARRMFFLPFEDYMIRWMNCPDLKMIILSSGTVSLEGLYHLIHNPEILSKEREGLFELKVPLYIGWHAGLVVKNKTLKLAMYPGSPIMCAGRLYILSSTVEAWDNKKNRYVPIKIPEAENYYLYGTQPVRPFIVVLRGGHLRIVSSTIRGLGYRGLFSSFGIGLSEWGIKKKMLLSPIMFILLHPKGLNVSSFESKAFIRLFTHQEKPSGVIVGSNLEGNYMGFYSNNAERLVIIGNIFRNNMQYNLDPHDWSKGIIVAYNIFEKAKKAHGVVFSRHTQGVVMNNISAGNRGAGIMMDRQSRSVISGNILFGNKLGGVSLLESDNNSICKNFIVRNGAYGIYVRNSLNTQVESNRLRRNLGAGVEVSVMNIGYQAYRNMYLDPYHMSSSAWIEGNRFYNNLKCEIKTHNGAVGIYKNRFAFFSSVPFCGDLSPYTREILTLQNKKPVVVLGRGNLSLIKRNLPDVKPYLFDIERKVLAEGNNEAELPIGLIEFMMAEAYRKALSGVRLNRDELLRCGIGWILRAARRGNVGALTALGVMLYTLTGESSAFSREGMITLAESAVLGDVHAMYILYLMPIMRGVDRNVIERSLEEGIKRIQSGRLINCDLWRGFLSCCGRETGNSKLLMRLSRFKKLVYLSRAKNYIEFIDKYAERFADRAFFEKVKRVKNRISEKNRRFESFFRWQRLQLKKAGEMYLEEAPEAVRFVNRELTVYQTWKSMLERDSTGDFFYIEPVLKKRLQEINLFREKGMRINVKAFLNRYKEEYFEVR